MKRTQLNFVVDAAAFGAFLFLLTTGLLLRYQVPVGSGGVHGMGSGRGGGERPVTLLWGYTRHEWGTIHYWIAGLLLAVLAVHIVLHWKWIVCVVRGAHGDASGLRLGLGFVSLVALVLLAAAPVVAPTETMSRSALQEERGETDASADEHGSEVFRGSMTVAEIAAAAEISVDELGALIDTGEISPDDQIGRLLRRHGQSMSDLRRALEQKRSHE